jgi:putative ABC transport system permease protein
MTPRDLVQEAVTAQRTYALRASLALIGIAAGVATVLVALAATAGARQRAEHDLGTLAPDTVVVTPHPDGPAGASHSLTLPLSRQLAHALADGVHVAALRRRHDRVSAGSRQMPAIVVGVSASWPAVARAGLAHGRWIGLDDESAIRRVAVIGDQVARQLADGAEPPDWVRVGPDWFRVVGVMAPRGQPGAGAMVSSVDLDRAALVPLGAVASSTQGCRDCVDEVVLRGEAEPRRVASLTRAVLGRLTRPVDPRAPGYDVVVAEELIEARLSARRASDLLLLVVGALALAIGGIGTTNILLAHVSERTAEIGVRRALGATRADVVRQIGLESVLLCSVGAVAGLTVGVASAAVVARVAGWDVLVTPAAVAIALASAFGVGIAAGVLPAHRAGALQPAAALREE